MHEVMWSQELQRLQAKTPTSLIRPLSPYLRSHAPQASPACDRPPTARGQPTVGPGTAPRNPPPPPPTEGAGYQKAKEKEYGASCRAKGVKTADRLADRPRTGHLSGGQVVRTGTGQVSVRRTDGLDRHLSAGFSPDRCLSGVCQPFLRVWPTPPEVAIQHQKGFPHPIWHMGNTFQQVGQENRSIGRILKFARTDTFCLVRPLWGHYMG